VTRGPLFAAGADNEGQGTPRLAPILVFELGRPSGAGQGRAARCSAQNVVVWCRWHSSSVINTRSSHPGGCIEDSNLRQACLGFAHCAIPWTDGHPWRGLDSNVLPSCMRSRGCEHASMQMVQDGWVTLRLARCVADGWIGMHCDFILGPRGFGYCIIPGS